MLCFTALLLRTACPTPLALAQIDESAAVDDGDAWRITEERWYIMELGGAKVGWVNTIIATDGERIRTHSINEMQVGRGTQQVSIRLATTQVERITGEPVMMELEQKTAAQTVHTRWEFNEDHILQTARQGDREITQRLPCPADSWLMAAGVERYVREQLEAGAQSFTYRTIDPSAGANRVVTVTSRRTGQGAACIDDKIVPITIWTTSNDVMPIDATEHYTSDGRLVHQEMATAMGRIVLRHATKAQATAPGDKAPEVLAPTFVKPSEPIADPMRAVKATLRLRAKDGRLTALPSAGAQHAEMDSAGASALLTIDINNNLPAAAEELTDDEYRRASAMIDSDDELVRKLSNRAVRTAGDDIGAKAEAMRSFVHRHINRKGLQTAFASASETARTRTGDCSEHAVLLCAMLRAQDIPARIAMGLVYADAFAGHEGIFGWHMWTQALIDGAWVDFDATLPQRYNAAHVLTAVSSMNDGMGTSDMANMMLLMGNIEIEVVSVEYE